MGFGFSKDTLAIREQGFALPHPMVSVSVFMAMEEAITLAWTILHTSPPRPFDPVTANENTYTTHLHEILEDHLLDSGLVGGFDGDTFSGIKRPEVRNFNGQKPSKKPDMVAYLADRPNVKRSQDGLFIECKPVDAKHSLTGDYCKEGIHRFVDGDYAWAMTEALMVGYNTVHKKPSHALMDPFRKQAKIVLAIGNLQDCPSSPHQPPVAISQHKRIFPIGPTGQTAPPIQLRHLWLAAPDKSPRKSA